MEDRLDAGQASGSSRTASSRLSRRRRLLAGDASAPPRAVPPVAAARATARRLLQGAYSAQPASIPHVVSNAGQGKRGTACSGRIPAGRAGCCAASREARFGGGGASPRGGTPAHGSEEVSFAFRSPQPAPARADRDRDLLPARARSWLDRSPEAALGHGHRSLRPDGDRHRAGAPPSGHRHRPGVARLVPRHALAADDAADASRGCDRGHQRRGRAAGRLVDPMERAWSGCPRPGYWM
jgi:hypothetical protein